MDLHYRMPSLSAVNFNVSLELTLSVVLCGLHAVLTAADFSSMKSWLSESYFRRLEPACQVQDAVKLRVEEAMQKLTEENFILASRLLQHGMLLAVIMYACMGAPCFTLLCFGFYAAFMLIAKGYVHMTAARVKLRL